MLPESSKSYFCSKDNILQILRSSNFGFSLKSPSPAVFHLQGWGLGLLAPGILPTRQTIDQCESPADFLDLLSKKIILKPGIVEKERDFLNSFSCH